MSFEFLGFNIPVGPLLFLAGGIGVGVLIYFLRDNIRRTKAWTFLLEVRKELGNVTWPSKDTVVNSTIVVIITTILVSIFIFLSSWFIQFVFSNIREGARGFFGGGVA